MEGSRILLVDDHQIFRQCLARALDEQPDLQVAAEADCLQQARYLLGSQPFDVVVVDLGLPDGSGLQLLREMLGQKPALVLSMSVDERTVVEALEAGALGYVPKGASLEDLLQALRSVLRGLPFLHPLVGSAVFRHLQGAKGQALTERERAVLLALSRGQATQSIARDLHVSASTVKAHLHTLFQKLRVANRTEAVARGVENGWLNERCRPG